MSRRRGFPVPFALLLVLPALGRPAPAAEPAPPEVPVALSLLTPLRAGAVFVEWSDAGGDHDVVASTFLEHVGAKPIEVGFKLPAVPGELRIHLVGKDSRQYRYAPLRVDFDPYATPVVDAVERDERLELSLRP